MAQTPDAQWEAPIYNIKAVSRMTGVPADTLRRWESRYGVIAPQRTEGGYRLYSQHDVDTINWLKARLEEGLSISRACQMLRQLGGDPGAPVTALPVAAQRPAPVGAPRIAGLPLSGEHGVRSMEALRTELFDALSDVDEERAGLVLSDALGLYSVEEVCLGLLQPVLVDVGEAWLRGDVSVAVEHFASAFVRNRLSNLFHSSPFHVNGPLVIVACAPGELHELGALFLAVFLRRAGFRVIYLGQNVPTASLQEMIEWRMPDAVCISATRAETASHMYGLRQFLDELQERRGHTTLLAYGGHVFNKFPDISARLGGAFLGEDAGTFVRRLQESLQASRKVN